MTKHDVRHADRKRFPIKRKMYIFVICVVVLTAFIPVAMQYNISAKQIDRFYMTTTMNTAENFAALLDPEFLSELRETILSPEYQSLRERAEKEDNEELIRTYFEEKGLWDRYTATSELLNRYLKNTDYARYLYILAVNDGYDDHDTYLMDDEDNPIYITGSQDPTEAEFADAQEQEVIEPTISSGEWGWLCSAYAPVYDKNGRLICHVGCDVSMDEVMNERHQLLMLILTGVVIFTVIILFFAAIFVNRTLVRPLNRLSMAMPLFRPAENTDYREAGVMELDIQSNDEIRDIYQEIRSMQMRIVDYLNDLYSLGREKERAEEDIRIRDEQIDEISRTAYVDPLTAVGSKAAYTEAIKELNEEIERSRNAAKQGKSSDPLAFSIVMADMNFLKQINDNHGHKAGDLYLKGCCRMLCEAFKHSPVYRVGGDEFVVIVRGADYEDRHQKVEQLLKAYEKSYGQAEEKPWLRYSAAVGIADYASDDSTVELVFKRADQRMYENKREFHRLRTGTNSEK